MQFENTTTYAVLSTNSEGKPFDKTLVGSFVIIPKSHVTSPFDLSDEEWLDTKNMMHMVKNYLDKKHQPDGYNVGWNVGETAGQHVTHAHLHIIPRFSDEPFTNKGIRHWLKMDENIRP